MPFRARVMGPATRPTCTEPIGCECWHFLTSAAPAVALRTKFRAFVPPRGPAVLGPGWKVLRLTGELLLLLWILYCLHARFIPGVSRGQTLSCTNWTLTSRLTIFTHGARVAPPVKFRVCDFHVLRKKVPDYG